MKFYTKIFRFYIFFYSLSSICRRGDDWLQPSTVTPLKPAQYTQHFCTACAPPSKVFYFTKNILLYSSSFLRFLGFKCFTNHPSISWYIIGLNQLQSVTIIFVGPMVMFNHFIVKSGDQMLISGLLITLASLFLISQGSYSFMMF